MKKIATALLTISLVAALGVSALASATVKNSTAGIAKGSATMGQHQQYGDKGGRGGLMNWTVDELKSYLAMTNDERTAYLAEKESQTPEKLESATSTLTDEERQAEREARRTEMEATKTAIDEYYNSLSDEDKAVIDAIKTSHNGGMHKGRP